MTGDLPKFLPIAAAGATDPAKLALLQSLLPLAVADMIRRVRPEPWPNRLARIARIRAAWALEGRESWSEALLYRTPDGVCKGVPVSGTRTEFKRLAEALAVMSFLPGGVRLFGMHWESKEEPTR